MGLGRCAKSIHRQTDRQTDNQTYIQTDGQWYRNCSIVSLIITSPCGRRLGIVFASLCLFVCLSVCYEVAISRENGSSLNFYNRQPDWLRNHATKFDRRQHSAMGRGATRFAVPDILLVIIVTSEQ